MDDANSEDDSDLLESKATNTVLRRRQVNETVTHGEGVSEIPGMSNTASPQSAQSMDSWMPDKTPLQSYSNKSRGPISSGESGLNLEENLALKSEQQFEYEESLETVNNDPRHQIQPASFSSDKRVSPKTLQNFSLKPQVSSGF